MASIPGTTTTDTLQEHSFQPSDFSFLSQLLHILEKTEAGAEASEIATLASNLKTSFKKCQTILDHLPGADLSPDEQEKILIEEQRVLQQKKAQLAQYLDWDLFQHESTLQEPVPLADAPFDDMKATSSSLKTEDTGSTQEEAWQALASSGQSHAPTGLATGLTFDMSDVKMEDARGNP